MTRYLAGLLVFSGVGSFLITDTLNFLRLGDRSFLDFLRLVVLTVIVVVGYNVASATFIQPKDLIIFLAIGIIGAFIIHTLTMRFRKS